MNLFKKLGIILGVATSLMGSDDVAVFFPAPASGSEAALEARKQLFEHLNKFTDWLLSFTEIKYASLQKFKEAPSSPELLKQFDVSHGFFSKISPLVGQYSPSKDDILAAQECLAKIDSLDVSSDVRLFYIQEVLAKVLAYRHLSENDLIEIPDFQIKGTFHTYRVSQVLNLGWGMPAYCLTSIQNAPSLLIYRGTHFDLTDRTGLASIVADLDIFGPGYSAFFKIKQQLESFFITQGLNQKKTVVLGYSLGGILSLYTGVFFKPYLDLRYCCAFNPPGVQKKLLNLCSKQKILDDFQVYVNQNDPVSKWGFLVGHVDLLSKNEHLGPLEAHTLFMSAQDHLEFSSCNLQEENERHRYFFLPE